MSVKTAYIVDIVRTAGGKRNGSLSKTHPADLGSEVINALLDRTKIDGKLVDDVIFGCVSQVGAQAANVARGAVLGSKLPISVPATTVDRQCGSSQQALHFAAQAVMSGTQDIVIAGGVELMSLVPIGSNVAAGAASGHGVPMSENQKSKYPAQADEPTFSQFEGAELVAQEFKCSRPEMEQFALESHLNAAQAIKEGRFKNEIVTIQARQDEEGKVTKPFSVDEGVRPTISLQAMAKLKTLKDGGLITAAVASQITDGASACLIMNEEGLKKTGLKPRAKIVALALAGDDPVVMLRAPIPATKKALQLAKMTPDQIDLYEINEAFASVPLAVMKALNISRSKVNVNGGAIALGHPLGATGVKLMSTLVNELERRKARFGLLTMCEGGGMANATIIERLEDGKAKL